MSKEKIIEIIRSEAQKQNKTLKSMAEYAGMKSTYINKFLGGGCGLPSKEKLQKIEEFLHINLMQYIETPETIKNDNEKLKAENESLKVTVKKYEQFLFIYNNFGKLEILKKFLERNKDLIQQIMKFFQDK